MKKLALVFAIAAFVGCTKMPSAATMNALAPCIEAVNAAAVYGRQAVDNPRAVDTNDVIIILNGLKVCQPLIDATKI